ncbi:MAG: GIY-YIG nuclease family protein [Deltaproteobacteria bacterium]|nr:GIY-YIG nuclease family protein [Deltaproteobacteria bacterium]
MQKWYLYIVRCRNGSLYTGIATDVERRFAEHQANKGSKYLRGRGPLKLVFKKEIGKKELALKIERLVKRLPKLKKEKLIKANNDNNKIFST